MPSWRFIAELLGEGSGFSIGGPVMPTPFFKMKSVHRVMDACKVLCGISVTDLFLDYRQVSLIST